MSSDFDAWLESAVPKGVDQCHHLNEREIQLMREAFQAGRDVQNRVKLIPMDEAAKLRQRYERNGVNRNNWVKGEQSIALNPENQPGNKVIKDATSKAMRKVKLGKRPAHCRQCGHTLKPGTEALMVKYPFTGWGKFGTQCYLHLHDCGEPPKEHARNSDYWG